MRGRIIYERGLHRVLLDALSVEGPEDRYHLQYRSVRERDRTTRRVLGLVVGRGGGQTFSGS